MSKIRVTKKETVCNIEHTTTVEYEGVGKGFLYEEFLTRVNTLLEEKEKDP